MDKVKILYDEPCEHCGCVHFFEMVDSGTVRFICWTCSKEKKVKVKPLPF